MKILLRNSAWKSFVALFMFCFIQLSAWAQNSPNTTSSTTIKTTTTQHTEWYSLPWVWIVGGAVLILLLVAILSSGRSSNRTTVTRSTDMGTGTSRTVTTSTDEG